MVCLVERTGKREAKEQGLKMVSRSFDCAL